MRTTWQIQLHDAVFGYAGRPVVRTGRLTLSPGRCLGVFGHNGSGKTTFVRGLLGLLPAIGGRVERSGGPLRQGFLAQHRTVDPTWPMSGFDVATLNLSAHRRFGWLCAADRVAVRRVMQETDAADLAGHAFATLSGGQQQRILLAGALAAGPDVLALDEPTDGLDVAARGRLLRTLGGLTSAALCVVLVSHDLRDLIDLTDDVAWIRPASDGGPSTVEYLTADSLARQLLHGGVR